jgi:hypothetical protein
VDSSLTYHISWGVDCYHVEKKHQQPELAIGMEQQQKVLAGCKDLWEQIEPYFCEFIVEEFEELLSNRQFSAAQIDPCFFIPVVGSGMELGENLDPPHPPALVGDDSSDVNLNLGTHNEELVSNRVKECSNNYIGTCVELVGEDASNTDKCDQDMQLIV